jgi:hypothetical protein
VSGETLCKWVRRGRRSIPQREAARTADAERYLSTSEAQVLAIHERLVQDLIACGVTA